VALFVVLGPGYHDDVHGHGVVCAVRSVVLLLLLLLLGVG
jgi:hypothetical protein